VNNTVLIAERGQMQGSKLVECKL